MILYHSLFLILKWKNTSIHCFIQLKFLIKSKLFQYSYFIKSKKFQCFIKLIIYIKNFKQSFISFRLKQLGKIILNKNYYQSIKYIDWMSINRKIYKLL